MQEKSEDLRSDGGDSGRQTPVILKRGHSSGDMGTDYYAICDEAQVGASPRPPPLLRPIAKRAKVAQDTETDTSIRLPRHEQHRKDAKKVKFAPVLYHIGLTDERAREVFADVRFIVMGGTVERMGRFATALQKKIGTKATRVSSTSRFTLYKVGPVIVVNHGMGAPSVSILVNELVMALRMACVPCNEVEAFRIGTSGGIGVEPGKVVVSAEVLNEKLEPFHEVIELGKEKKYPTGVSQEIVTALDELDDVIVGKTMSANCFYSNQGRLDGAFVDFTYEDKMAFLERLQHAGVKNIEMEAVCFSAWMHRAGIKACIVCMPLVDRLQGEVPAIVDNPHLSSDIVINYILSKTKKA
ncbi:Uridine phosphorylase 1 [Hondaea fermentalgiana]|uniref:Uridine phosphorylase 1 n=1 Tax=Hondaea fermentalgiana TaxID=2315210 RepID=A0A2R5GIV2_9STRA|nr:Uridine phosphorylase 1 [Hondaea fermentalgiana]|eukprot:GBG28583.1 Uridine phosphorylase 1 [Hondaea fermentalgiana]